eukprot:9503206-Pyramimonas_sp.AAC.1
MRHHRKQARTSKLQVDPKALSPWTLVTSDNNNASWRAEGRRTRRKKERSRMGRRTGGGWAHLRGQRG